MVQLREVLRLWLRGGSYRAIARVTAIDRKTVRRYVAAAQDGGLRRGDSEDELTDDLLAAIAHAVRPGRRHGFGHGQTWEVLQSNRAFIEQRLGDDVTVTKIRTLVSRRTGIDIPYRTLHRFCVSELGRKSPQLTVRAGEVGAAQGGSHLSLNPSLALGVPSVESRRFCHLLARTDIRALATLVFCSRASGNERVRPRHKNGNSGLPRFPSKSSIKSANGNASSCG